MEAHNSVMYKTKARIKGLMQRQKERLERNININNSRGMLKTIKGITSYKSRSTPAMCEVTVADRLNSFYLEWYIENNLLLSVSKVKEKTVEFTKRRQRHGLWSVSVEMSWNR